MWGGVARWPPKGGDRNTRPTANEWMATTPPGTQPVPRLRNGAVTVAHAEMSCDLAEVAVSSFQVEGIAQDTSTNAAASSEPVRRTAHGQSRS